MILLVITEIVYRFLDSSVPPPYHRSYTITVTPQEVRVVVDSYGDVIADETTPLEPGVFDGLVSALTESDIRPCETVEPDGCTGGTTGSLTVSAGSDTVLSGWVHHCGGREYGNLQGNLEEFADRMRALVPNLAELRRT